MNREVHVRFWESPEVKVLRATRPIRSRRSSSTESAYWGEAENICSLRGFRILTQSGPSVPVHPRAASA